MVAEKIKLLTKIYYSKPEIQKALLEFSQNREVVPRYLEGFGKRPDTLQYQSDIMGLVNKGATSFHASEEIWKDPFQISSDMSTEQLDELRKSWDLLIDIDSQFFDYSRIAAKLIIESLEKHGVTNYGIKFSGSRGFHIIVPGKAFPKEYEGNEMRKMFPEWPRAISKYLLSNITPKYNKLVTESDINFEALKERTKLTKEDVTEITCPNCGKPSKKGNLVILECDRCKNTIERPNLKITKRKLKCIDPTCPGFYKVKAQKENFYCENCGSRSSPSDFQDKGRKIVYTQAFKSKRISSDFKEEVLGSKIASPDLVLVSSRHLFRMPYSLHEKTSLASVVITKNQLETFNPRDANPMNVKILPFYPEAKENEAEQLLKKALSWHELEEQKVERTKRTEYKEIDVSGVTEDMFPKPIKKLLKGLTDGRKRGLFILLTFFKSLNFPDDYIEAKVWEWNKKNEKPLKDGYVRSQLTWHLKQKKKILPPNYSNNSYYKDLQLLDSEPKTKNPVGDVIRILRAKERG